MAGAATSQASTEITVPAGADLSASQYCAVDINSSGQAVLPSAGGRVAGILVNDPAAAGRGAEVGIAGVQVVKLGGTVAAGDAVKADSSGRAVTAGAGDIGFGICKKGGAINELGEVLLVQPNTIDGGDLEIVTSGAIAVNKQTTLLSITGTQAYTLGSGLYGGQRKTIQASVAASIPAGTITGVFTDTDGTTARTTAAFDAVADQLVIEWRASTARWQVLLKTSVTMG
jgi:hypothetical protein